jgi:hypothetical protein
LRKKLQHEQKQSHHHIQQCQIRTQSLTPGSHWMHSSNSHNTSP